MANNLIDRRITPQAHGGGTDLYGFPAGQAALLEKQRMARVRDPNASLGPEWEQMKKFSAVLSAELTEREIPNILPERFFVEGFLPMFAALFTNDPKEMPRISESGIIYTWVKVAGTPNRPVNVVYDDNEERVMYTVPPIYHRTKSTINLDPQSSILAMIDKAQRVHSSNPSKGNEFYYASLQHYSPRSSKEHIVADHVQLLRIFDHYDQLLWDERSGTYKTVKELGALDTLNLRAGKADAPAATARVSQGPATHAIQVGDVEEL